MVLIKQIISYNNKFKFYSKLFMSSEVKVEDTLIQYLIVRKDLTKKPYKWPTGSLISNACHASVAIICQYYEETDIRDYVNGKNHQMHKVTLAVNDEEHLRTIAQRLDDKNIRHRLWIEQPENMATCIATKPYPKSVIKSVLSDLKLFR